MSNINTVKFYRRAGGNYSEAVRRLKSESLIERLLKMLMSDNSVESLIAAINANDAGKAFYSVHTLKGVALNLGLDSLADVCSQMTEILRGHASIPPEAKQYSAAVANEFLRITEILAALYVENGTDKAENEAYSAGNSQQMHL